ncbi:MAG: hypothetical protein WA790_11620 [Sulfitobacter sp.]
MAAMQPSPWGLRGDPLLWAEMQERFRTTPLPVTQGGLVEIIEDAFKSITGHELKTAPDTLRVETLRRENGGMSNGIISPPFWRNTALPAIIVQFHKINPR